MTSLIVIAILGILLAIGALIIGVVFSKAIDALIAKGKADVKTIETDAATEWDRMQTNINVLADRMEANIKNNILSDEVFLKSLSDKLKTL